MKIKSAPLVVCEQTTFRQWLNGSGRRERLKVPQKQPKKGWLWLNDGSFARLHPERPNHVWSYAFVQDRTHDGRIFRTLNIIGEFTKEGNRTLHSGCA